MHNKTIYRMASLIMVLVMTMGNIMHTQAITGSSIYWGAMVDGKVPSSTNLAGVFNTFETRSQKRMSIIHWGQPWVMADGSWGEFQTTYFDNVRNHGSIPMLNWTSWRLGAGTTQANFQLRDIYNGTYDAYITRWATDARNWGHPFFLRFNHEGNGWWYPWGEGKTEGGAIVNGNSAGDFVRAWRHVHDIFTAVGATNVNWVWSMNHMSTSSRYPVLSTLYPGDAYVNWTGLSSYNKYDTWAGFNPLLTGSEGLKWFRNSYNDVLSVAPNKPLMLAEFGSFEAGDGGAKKAAWITDALTVQIPVNFPRIKAVVWMNWDVNEGRSYPIETSQAATNAWAAGIGSPVYASNQFANLNTSPIPPLLGSTGPADIAVNVGGVQQGSFTLQPHTSARTSFAGLSNGPVQINSTSGDPLIASQRVAYSPDGGSSWTSFSEFMGMPTGQLKDSYYFPWYNNLEMNTQLRVANVGSSTTTVKVIVAGALQGSYSLDPSQSMRTSYPGLNNGPVKVQSSGGVPIIASMRFAYIKSTDPVVVSGFSELMGLPANQLTSTYIFPWYNNVEMNTQLRFGNIGTSNTTVTVTIGGVIRGSYTLAPNQSQRVSYPIDEGPVKVHSSNGVPIIASMRFVYIQNKDPLVVPYFSEMLGLPQQNISTNYWFPVYDNVHHNMQLRFGNMGTSNANIVVKIGGTVQGTYTLAPKEAFRVSFTGLNNGPVQVLSTNGVPIIASMRFVYIRSASPLVVSAFSEMLGLPNEKLSNSYVFPWYNNVDLDTQLRIAVP